MRCGSGDSLRLVAVTTIRLTARHRLPTRVLLNSCLVAPKRAQILRRLMGLDARSAKHHHGANAFFLAERKGPGARWRMHNGGAAMLSGENIGLDAASGTVGEPE